MVAGVYLSVTGNVHGASLFIFPEKTVLNLINLLFSNKSKDKKDLSTKKPLSKLDKSMLEKISNVICENFLSEFAKALKIQFLDSAPKFTFDVLGSVVNNFKSEFVRRFNQRLVMEIKLDLGPIAIEGPVIIVFGFEETQLILKALKRDK